MDEAVTRLIESAIQKGQEGTLQGMSELEALVWVIADTEAEVDINGMTGYLQNSAGSRLEEASQAFRAIGALRIARALEVLTGRGDEQTLIECAGDLIQSRADDYGVLLEDYLDRHTR